MYRGGFIEAANAYTLYEYAKMVEAGRERARRIPDLYPVSNQKDPYTTTIDACADFYSKLSPMAALMTGRNVRVDCFFYRDRSVPRVFNWLYEHRAIKRYLEKFKQPQSTAVKLFAQYEVAVQRFKICRIQDTISSQKRGDCCESSCDPCECC